MVWPETIREKESQRLGDSDVFGATMALIMDNSFCGCFFKSKNCHGWHSKKWNPITASSALLGKLILKEVSFYSLIRNSSVFSYLPTEYLLCDQSYLAHRVIFSKCPVFKTKPNTLYCYREKALVLDSKVLICFKINCILLLCNLGWISSLFWASAFTLYTGEENTYLIRM